MSKTVYKNIKQLLTLEGVKKKDGRKVKKEDLSIIENAYIVAEDKKIIEVGSGNSSIKDAKVVDLNNTVVMPSFVDSHTHLTFGGNRAFEFEMRSEGKTYLDIAKKGGGILLTVEKTRSASLEDLIKIGKKNIKRMNAFGVGLIEAKSGYGLDTETEIKQLRALKEIKKEYPHLEITFLGAHDTPPLKKGEKKEDRKKAYIYELIDKMLPIIGKENLAKFCDIFLEEGYYTREESEFILNKAKDFNLIPKLHVDEFTNQEGASLAAKLKAASADHLLYVSDKGIKDLADSETVATVLPGTAFTLGLNYAPARKLIDGGACVSIASDFNPGSNPGINFQLALVMAVTQMKMSIAETISAGTYAGAKALKREDEFGAILPGYKLAIQAYNVSNYNEIFYNYGENYLSKLII